MPRRDVDRQLEALVLLEQRLQFRERDPHQLPCQRADASAFLGQFDEAGWREHCAVWPDPAGEHFSTAKLADLQVEDRLVVGLYFSNRERPVEVLQRRS